MERIITITTGKDKGEKGRGVILVQLPQTV